MIAALRRAPVVLIILVVVGTPAVRPQPTIYVRERGDGDVARGENLATSEAAATAQNRRCRSKSIGNHVCSAATTPAASFADYASMGTPRAVSPELFDVLERFDRWRERTNGALDASALKPCRASGKRRNPPDGCPRSDLRPAVASVAAALAARCVAAHRHAPRCHALDAQFLHEEPHRRSRGRAGIAQAGVRGIVVNAGGDLVTRGDWTEAIDITDPQASADNARPRQCSLGHAIVATSGGYRRGFDIDGVHYSHIVDPRTGRPAGHAWGDGRRAGAPTPARSRRRSACSHRTKASSSRPRCPASNSCSCSPTVAASKAGGWPAATVRGWGKLAMETGLRTDDLARNRAAGFSRAAPHVAV